MIQKTLPILALALLVSSAHAQSQKVGRLSDGRAYRVDDGGVRLIDQLAELEVTNDDLKRQVVALEDEITEKNKTIESLRAGVKVPSEEKLKEQDLLGKTASGLPKAAVVSSCDQSELEALKLQLANLNRGNQQTAETNQLAEINKQLVGKNQQLIVETSQLAEENEQLIKKGKQLSEVKNRAEFIAQENERNKDKIALLSAEKNQLITQLAEAKSPDPERNNLVLRIGKLEQEKLALNQEIDDLRSDLNQASRDKENLVKDLEQKDLVVRQNDKLVGEKSNDFEKLQQEVLALKEQLVDSQLAAQATRSRMVETPPPVVKVNTEAKNLIATIQSKIMKRKSLLDNVAKSGKGIALSASSLTTKNGLSLDRLRQSVNSGSADSTVTKGLNEISAILDSDISTATRLAR